MQGLILPLRGLLFLFSNLTATLLILVSPSKIWFLFSASLDLNSRQLPITIIKTHSTETVCIAWKFAFFWIWQCGTFWVSNVQLHEGTLQLLLVQLLWKPQARWRLGQPCPSCNGVNPSAAGWSCGKACIFLPYHPETLGIGFLGENPPNPRACVLLATVLD